MDAILNRYRRGDSLIHRLDPRVKVILTVLFIVSTVLLPDGAWPAFLMAWGLVLVAGRLADVGPRYLVTRSFVALPFALAAVTVIFAVPGRPVGEWALGPWILVATDAGLTRFASIVIRSWLSVQGAILLTTTTSFPELMHALHRLRVPATVVAVISFMYRYLFVLVDEAQRMLRARTSRSARPVGTTRAGGSILWRAGVAGNMVGHLFLRSYERSERVYSAMLARGYTGEFLTIDAAHCVHVRTVSTTDSANGDRRDAEPALVVDGLSFRYPDGRQALDDVSLRVAPGEKVALVGPNGAGKSTLLLHFNGLLRGDGYVEVGGRMLEPSTLAEIRARVGLVFQNPDDQLFSPTVFEDVAFGPLHMGLPEATVRTRVVRALQQVNMEGYADRLSHRLSIGEKKRIAIATVLSMDPEILVLDEPSAGLDPRARRSLITLLRELTQTMLVATHDMRLVYELFPRTVIMDAGKIVADGRTDDLMNDVELLEAHGLERP